MSDQPTNPRPAASEIAGGYQEVGRLAVERIALLADPEYVDLTIPSAGPHRRSSFDSRQFACMVCVLATPSQPYWPCRAALLHALTRAQEKVARLNLRLVAYREAIQYSVDHAVNMDDEYRDRFMNVLVLKDFGSQLLAEARREAKAASDRDATHVDMGVELAELLLETLHSNLSGIADHTGPVSTCISRLCTNYRAEIERLREMKPRQEPGA